MNETIPVQPNQQVIPIDNNPIGIEVPPVQVPTGVTTPVNYLEQPNVSSPTLATPQQIVTEIVPPVINRPGTTLSPAQTFTAITNTPKPAVVTPTVNGNALTPAPVYNAGSTLSPAQTFTDMATGQPIKPKIPVANAEGKPAGALDYILAPQSTFRHPPTTNTAQQLEVAPEVNPQAEQGRPTPKFLQNSTAKATSRVQPGAKAVRR